MLAQVQRGATFIVWSRPAKRKYLPFQIAVHDRKEHLKEEVDGIYQHRQKVQPCFASHCETFLCVRRPMIDKRGFENGLAVRPVNASARASEATCDVETRMRSCVCRLLDGLDAES